MICEQAFKVHIREFGKNLPDHVFVYARRVQVTTSKCHLGGHRYWFSCPSCSRRCAILYPYCCRKCVDGRYAKELMTPLSRKIDRAIDLRMRLGQRKGGIVVRFPIKPKWMRWHTYLRLRAKSLVLEQEIWEAEWARLPASVRSKYN